VRESSRASTDTREVGAETSTARELILKRYLPKGYYGDWWTEDEIAFIGRVA
jgi:hypothetical protein